MTTIIESGYVAKAIKASTILVPYDVYLTLGSLANSAIPTTYNIIPTPEGDLCVGKIDQYNDEILMWWVCGRRDGRIDVLTPRGHVAATIVGDRVHILDVEADRYDYIAPIDASPKVRARLVRVAQVVVAARRILRWVYSLYPPLLL